MTSKKAAALAAAVAALAALPAASAHAAVLNCGDSVTQDTRLDADVGPWPANTFGLVGNAPTATLDLHGHRVLGTGRTGDGIHVNSLGVTVTDGRIDGFATGVSA